jgi:predicted lipoprotein with Yx(FWY)xxD motif
MAVHRRWVQVVGTTLTALIAVTLLGCSSSGDRYASTTSATASAIATATTASTSAAGAATETSAVATTLKVGAANALVESKGLTLYVFKNDSAGKSACTGGCATTWPPLTVTGTPSKASGISGDLGTITRDDGTTQVTYKGQPLYRFAADTAAGDAKGAAIANWSVATP